MGDRLSIPFRCRSDVRVAEGRARAIMAASDPPYAPVFGYSDGESYRWWSETFGATETEFEEILTALAHRYRRTPVWRRKARRALMASYVSVSATLTVGHGLEVVWE